MSQSMTQTPVKTEAKAAVPAARTPVDSLRREIDRLFENFDRGLWSFPFRGSFFDTPPPWKNEPAWNAPAVDIVEKDNAFQVTAEMPGMDEKGVEVKLENGVLAISGEKREDKEENDKGYHLQERRYGSFERRFAVPDGVNVDKIEANFKNGVLTVTLPKTQESAQPEKKIEVKPA
jgi:HSP20 family protein